MDGTLHQAQQQQQQKESVRCPDEPSSQMKGEAGAPGSSPPFFSYSNFLSIIR